jgi:hypothetical protein
MPFCAKAIFLKSSKIKVIIKFTGVNMKKIISLITTVMFLSIFADLALAYRHHGRYYHRVDRHYNYNRHGLVRNTGHVAGETVRGTGQVAGNAVVGTTRTLGNIFR